LSALGLWLCITSDGQNSVKMIRLGMLAVLWGLLIGAFAMFGSRRPHADEAREMHAPAQSGSAVELRSRSAELRSRSAELERAEEAARRRDHEERLERMLRREIHSAVADEVATLRSEIGQLRSELLDKVDGRLRLERIETTRIIGSDLEALQHEVRELKHATRDTGDVPLGRSRVSETTSVRQIVEPARVRPVTRQTAEVEADVQPARQPRREPEPVLRPESAPRPASAVPATEQTTPIRMPAREPQASGLPTAGIPAPTSASPPAPPPNTPAPPPNTPPSTPAPTSSSAPSSTATPTAPAPTTSSPLPPPQPTGGPTGEPRPSPSPPADPFAGLPRIRPFTDFELDPIEDDASYTGRRRKGEETDQPRGRHSRDGEPSGRRRAPENGDELLARLLARESARG
jgi:hypothetical protein